MEILRIFEESINKTDLHQVQPSTVRIVSWFGQVHTMAPHYKQLVLFISKWGCSRPLQVSVLSRNLWA